jgi:hypothetical protein
MEMTQYQADDYEHKNGRWEIHLDEKVLTRYFARYHADEHLARLRAKIYGRTAKIFDRIRNIQVA